MSDDLVTADVGAVRTLKRGVERYAEQIRDAAGHARREIVAADRKAQEAVQRRRSEVRNRVQDHGQAEAALRRCRENCGELQQRVKAAAQRLAAAEHELDRARWAAQLTATAQSDLMKVLQNIEATVGEHSSVASSTLASLDAKLAEAKLAEAKLAERRHSGIGQAVHNLAVGTVVGVELLGASMSLGRVAGNAFQAFNVNIPIHDESVTEMVENRKDQERNYVIEQDFESRKRMSSREQREDKP